MNVSLSSSILTGCAVGCCCCGTMCVTTGAGCSCGLYVNVRNCPMSGFSVFILFNGSACDT